jgi:hypothetical protein
MICRGTVGAAASVMGVMVPPRPTMDLSLVRRIPCPGLRRRCRPPCHDACCADGGSVPRPGDCPRAPTDGRRQTGVCDATGHWLTGSPLHRRNGGWRTCRSTGHRRSCRPRSRPRLRQGPRGRRSAATPPVLPREGSSQVTRLHTPSAPVACAPGQRPMSGRLAPRPAPTWRIDRIVSAVSRWRLRLGPSRRELPVAGRRPRSAGCSTAVTPAGVRPSGRRGDSSCRLHAVG